MSQAISDERHISSLVVTARVEHIHGLAKQMASRTDIEVAGEDASKGKIVVLLETDTLKQIEQTIAQLQGLEGVVSVFMVYHHCEDNNTLEELVRCQ